MTRRYSSALYFCVINFSVWMARTVESSNCISNETFINFGQEKGANINKKTNRRVKRSCHVPTGDIPLTVPDNMTFDQTVLFWETLVCPMGRVCDAENDIDHGIPCSPFSCAGCGCEYCDKHNDCCADRAVESLHHPTAIARYTSCKIGGMGTENFVIPSDYNYVFVDKCPEDFEDTRVKYECEDPVTSSSLSEIRFRLPVYSPETETSYFNTYCARCHGDDSDLHLWNSEVICSRRVDISGYQSELEFQETILKKHYCSIVALPVEEIMSFPCSSDTRSCNVSSHFADYKEEISTACRIYQNNIKIFETVYRNIFCAFCAGIDPDDILRSFKSPYKCGGAFGASGGRIYSFSVLFNFREKIESSNKQSERGLTECPQNKLYDPFLNECRALVCHKGRLQRNHTCVDAYKSANGVGYRVEFFMSPNTSMIVDRQEPLEKIWENYKTYFEGENSILLLSAQLYHLKINICFVVNNPLMEMEHLSVEFSVVLGEDFKPEYVETELMKNYQSIWRYGDTVWLSKYSIAKDNSSLTVGLEKCAHFEDMTTSDDTPVDYIVDNDSFISVNKVTRCNQIELDPSEYVLDHGSGAITLDASNKSIGPSEYLITNGSVRICVNYTGWFEKSSNSGDNLDETKDSTQNVLTRICVALSLSGLTLTLIIYFAKQSRHTVPGQITIILLCSLFVAQCLFLVSASGEDSKWACRLLGMALHYAWLEVFAWKIIAAFHMCSVFNRPFDHIDVRHTRTMLRYCLFGFGVPLVIVLVYVLIHLLTSDLLEIGYGGKVCFLSEPLYIGVAFALPVGLVLIGNVFFFVRAVRAIHQMSQLEQRAQQKNSSHNALFVKMSVVLGFTWVAGFVANVFDHPVLWYIFIIFNGGIGLTILFSRVCNKATARHILGKLGGSSRGVTTSMTNLSTVHTSSTPNLNIK